MKVVCLLSGGLDSATLLADLLAKGHQVRCLSVFYGQRHRREVDSAKAVAGYYGVAHDVVELPDSLMRGSALTGGGEVPEGHYEDESMRQTVVPARNTVLLACAAAAAVREGCDAVAYGAHYGDHAIYPDCRSTFIEAMQTVLWRCDYKPINLLTPFLNHDKSFIVRTAAQLQVPVCMTWTCYAGNQLHCGRCGSCSERKWAFQQAGVPDPTEYEGG